MYINEALHENKLYGNYINSIILSINCRGLIQWQLSHMRSFLLHDAKETNLTTAKIG